MRKAVVTGISTVTLRVRIFQFSYRETHTLAIKKTQIFSTMYAGTVLLWSEGSILMPWADCLATLSAAYTAILELARSLTTVSASYHDLSV